MWSSLNYWFKRRELNEQFYWRCMKYLTLCDENRFSNLATDCVFYLRDNSFIKQTMDSNKHSCLVNLQSNSSLRKTRQKYKLRANYLTSVSFASIWHVRLPLCLLSTFLISWFKLNKWFNAYRSWYCFPRPHVISSFRYFELHLKYLNIQTCGPKLLSQRLLLGLWPWDWHNFYRKLADLRNT